MLDDIARLLMTARATGAAVPEADMGAIADVDTGYDVQRRQIALAGDDIAGWKLGATAQASLALLDLPEPFLGPLLPKAIGENGGTVPISAAHLNFVETELCLTLASGLPQKDAYDTDELSAAVASLRAACEVVSARFEGGLKGNGRWLIADNAVNNAVILGDEMPLAAFDDAAAETITLTLNGDTVATGTAEALIFGHVLNGLAYIAARQDVLSRPLAAGDILMTGTMTGMTPVQPGADVHAKFGALADVRLTLPELG